MLTIQNINVYDLVPSVLASGYAMRTDPLDKPLDSYTEDSEEFKKLDSIIKRGVDKNKSIYQIKIENNDIIDKLITTLYRYINKDYLPTKK